MKCPECNCTSLAVEVETWLNFEDGKPESFDPEDLDSGEPKAGAKAICRECQHQFPVPGYEAAPSPELVALDELLAHCAHLSPFVGVAGVRSVREAGKFMKAFETAQAAAKAARVKLAL